MFAGESIPVTFTAKKYLINDIIDWFGKDVRFSNETEDEVTVDVRVNRHAMRCWALQYALHIKITAPADLANDVKCDIMEAGKKYID